MQRTTPLIGIVIVLILALLAVGTAAAQEATETPTLPPNFAPGAQITPEATAPATATPATAPAGDTTTPASSGLLRGIRDLHALVRWIVVLVTVIVLIKLVLGLVQNAPYDALTERLMRAFNLAISLQWLIGLVFFIVLITVIGFGGLQLFNWLHLIVMTVAVGLAGMYRRFQDAPDRNRYRANLTIVVLVLVLVFIGVALLPYGWRVFPPR